MFGRSSHEEHPHDSEDAGAFEVFTHSISGEVSD